MADAQAVLGSSATTLNCAADNCNYGTDGGVGALNIAEATGASKADFTTSTQGYTSFSGVGDAAAYRINLSCTADITFLHGTLMIAVTVRNAPQGEVTPVSAAGTRRATVVRNTVVTGSITPGPRSSGDRATVS